jgi:hypothetical protein
MRGPCAVRERDHLDSGGAGDKPLTRRLRLPWAKSLGKRDLHPTTSLASHEAAAHPEQRRPLRRCCRKRLSRLAPTFVLPGDNFIPGDSNPARAKFLAKFENIFDGFSPRIAVAGGCGDKIGHWLAVFGDSYSLAFPHSFDELGELSLRFVNSDFHDFSNLV